MPAASKSELIENRTTSQRKKLTFQSRFILQSSGSLGIVILFGTLIRHFFFDYEFVKLIVPYLMSGLFFYISYREKNLKSNSWHKHAILAGMMLVILNAARVNGGFFAPIVSGVTIFPLYCGAAFGRRGHLLGILASLCCIVSVFIMDHFQLSAPAVVNNINYYPVMLLIISIFSAYIISSYEKARAKTEDSIHAMHEQLIGSAKLSSLGEMAGNMAHEINNPLTVIISRGRLLQSAIEKNKSFENSPELQKYRDDIVSMVKTSERIAKIISGLRSFSRNAEKDPMAETLLSKIIEDTLALCQERFKLAEVSLRVKCELGLVLKCRPTQVSQVLMNLLNNAFDAAQAQHDKWVEVSAESTVDGLRISVTDSGHGIPKAVVEKMLEPFFTTKPVGQGTGLGLSICRGIIEDHHGQFRYDESSQHTRFIIDLPISLVTKANPATAA